MKHSAAQQHRVAKRKASAARRVIPPSPRRRKPLPLWDCMREEWEGVAGTKEVKARVTEATVEANEWPNILEEKIAVSDPLILSKLLAFAKRRVAAMASTMVLEIPKYDDLAQGEMQDLMDKSEEELEATNEDGVETVDMVGYIEANDILQRLRIGAYICRIFKHSDSAVWAWFQRVAKEGQPDLTDEALEACRDEFDKYFFDGLDCALASCQPESVMWDTKRKCFHEEGDYNWLDSDSDSE